MLPFVLLPQKVLLSIFSPSALETREPFGYLSVSHLFSYPRGQRNPSQSRSLLPFLNTHTKLKLVIFLSPSELGVPGHMSKATSLLLPKNRRESGFQLLVVF